jgi:hypothetical protein
MEILMKLIILCIGIKIIRTNHINLDQNLNKNKNNQSRIASTC